MSFQFNFFKAEAVEPQVDATVVKGDTENTTTEWIISDAVMKSFGDIESEPVDNFSGLLKRKYSSIVSDLKGDNRELASITEESDVVPRQYEGGLKTWECSIDLLQFLKEESSDISRVGSVLEVGCGSGLPGIYCHQLVEHPKLFVFQDFNQSVLESVTLPNVLLNIPAYSSETFKFYYGDWKDLPGKLPRHSFDLILTSETIYRCESYSLLLDIFDRALEPEKGRVLLAAKDYYFGLGGSVQQFTKRASSLGWRVKLVRQFSEGVPRSILELTRNKH